MESALRAGSSPECEKLERMLTNICRHADTEHEILGQHAWPRVSEAKKCTPIVQNIMVDLRQRGLLPNVRKGTRTRPSPPSKFSKKLSRSPPPQGDSAVSRTSAQGKKRRPAPIKTQSQSQQEPRIMQSVPLTAKAR